MNATGSPTSTADALLVCSRCYVVEECAEYMGLVEGHVPPVRMHGVAAGMTPAQRRAARAGNPAA